jgi:hypothetical protein
MTTVTRLFGIMVGAIERTLGRAVGYGGSAEPLRITMLITPTSTISPMKNHTSLVAGLKSRMGGPLTQSSMRSLALASRMTATACVPAYVAEWSGCAWRQASTRLGSNRPTAGDSSPRPRTRPARPRRRDLSSGRFPPTVPDHMAPSRQTPIARFSCLGRRAIRSAPAGLPGRIAGTVVVRVSGGACRWW